MSIQNRMRGLLGEAAGAKIPDALANKIAKTHLFRDEPLVARNSDSLDFFEVGVLSLKDALNAAYAAGYAAAQKKKEKA